MKQILLPVLKGRLYFQNSNFNYKEQIFSKVGANLLTLTGYFISEFKDTIFPYVPHNVSATKINEDELKYFDKLCQDAKIILMQPPLPLNSFVNKFQLVLLSLIAFKYKEKIKFIFDDPQDIWTLKNSASPSKSLFSNFNLSRFGNDLTIMKNYVSFCKWAYEDAKKLFHVFYNHSPKEIQECYGTNCRNIYTMNTVKYFLDLPFNKISMSDKSPNLIYASLNIKRNIENNKTFLKKFNITDIKNFGADNYKSLIKSSSSLSEYEILQNYSKCKYILSFPIKKPSLTWDRRRILFAMMINSVLITNGYDAQYLGKPFQLDKSIFTKSDKELKSIADEQRDYFFSHVKTEEEIKKTIDEFLHK